MKRIVLVAAVAMLSLASCKKDYVCSITVLGTTTDTEDPGLNKSDAEDVEAACKLVGGTWSTK